MPTSSALLQAAIQRPPSSMPKLNKARLALSAWIGLAVSGSAMAYTGYDRNVAASCSSAQRPAPTFAAPPCSTCHSANYRSMTPAKTAYLADGTALLDFFCAAPAPVPVNHAPTVSVPSNVLSVAAGSLVSFAVSAQDPDAGDAAALSADVAGLPGAAFDPATGQFSWLAGAAQAAPYQAVFSATDQAGLASSTVVAITVHAVGVASNTAPSLAIPLAQQNVTVGQSLSFEVKASDAEGDDVRITSQSLPAGASLSIATQDAATGEWVSVFNWTPDSLPAANPLRLTFTATDALADAAAALSTSKSVSVQVNPVVSVPTIGVLNISKAKWESGRKRLKVAGIVKPIKGQRLPKGLSISLADASTGAVIAEAVKVNRKGVWKFTSGKRALSHPVCAVMVQSGGLTASTGVNRCASGTGYGSGEDHGTGESHGDGKDHDAHDSHGGDKDGGSEDHGNGQPLQGMHSVDAAWVHGHEATYKAGPSACKSCHGEDLRGTDLSIASAERRFAVEHGTKTIRAGEQVGCYTCHNGPDDDD